MKRVAAMVMGAVLMMADSYNLAVDAYEIAMTVGTETIDLDADE